MDTDASNTLARACRSIESMMRAEEPDIIIDARERCEVAGMPQGFASQASFLRLQANALGARSVILIGTACVVEALYLLLALAGDRPRLGQLTVVDSNPEACDLLRHAFERGVASRDYDHRAKLRVVSADLPRFLHRLNAGDYDLMVVSGRMDNYRPAIDEANHLLRRNGVLMVADALAFASDADEGGILNPASRSPKATGMRELIPELLEDERFVTSLVPVGTGLVMAVKA